MLPVGNWIFEMALVAEDNKLYYSDYYHKAIDVLSLDTHKITTLASVLQPRGFTVDRKMG